MVSKINVNELQDTLYKVIPASVDTESVVSKLGANKILGPETKLTWANIGGAAVVHESDEKPLSDIEIDERDVAKAKLVQLFSYSTEAKGNKTTQEVIDNLVQQAVASIAPSFDLAVLKGTSAATGNSDPRLADSAIVPNAPKTLLGEDYEASLNEAINSLNSYDIKMGLSPEAFFKLSDIKSATGLYVYRDLSPKSEFQYRWVDTIVSKLIDRTGWTSNTTFNDDTLVVLGDFESNVIRRLDSVSVRTSNETSIGGRSMFTHNEEAVLIEAEFSFAVKDFSSFAVLEKTVEEDED